MNNDISSLSLDLNEKNIPNTISFGETDTKLYIPDSLNPYITLTEKVGEEGRYHYTYKTFKPFEVSIYHDKALSFIEVNHHLSTGNAPVVILKSTIYPSLYWMYDVYTNHHILVPIDTLFNNSMIPQQLIFTSEEDLAADFYTSLKRQEEITHYIPIKITYKKLK